MQFSNNKQDQAHPSVLFFNSKLFRDVQMAEIFSDSKTFADAIPKLPVAEILSNYESIRTGEHIDVLKEFVDAHFDIPEAVEVNVEHSYADISEHIDMLWQALTKPADSPDLSSLLALKSPYVVPGGRFREIYYWDSYFTALGLIKSGKVELALAMLDNFVDLQTRFGCIPNGNRSYYLSRTQPPILGLLVELLLPNISDQRAFLENYVGAIENEYNFWMQGSDQLTKTETEHRRVVQMPDGSLLNRYWDDSCEPRPESYREDVELLLSANPENQSEFYRNIRAACESGWDFSSRWLGNNNALSSIRTTRILPIDLNCLLYKIEKLLAQFYLALGRRDSSQKYHEKAGNRKRAINRYMWSDSLNFFLDVDLDELEHNRNNKLSLAATLPLFVGLATEQQAKSVAIVIEESFLKSGGLVTTLEATGQQWDSPNGWAPLHWFTVQGLLNYQHAELASKITTRWNTTVEGFFNETGKLMEKYNVCQQNSKAGGGEYDVQEGFGWTNGVYQALKTNS